MATYNSFVFEGHGKSEKDGSFDPGAVNGNVTENQLTDTICKKVKYYLDTLAPQLKIHYDEQNFKDNDLVGNVYSCNSGISVHINSATGASGSEILVPCKEGYLGADFELVKGISDLLKIPNRGVKSRDYNSEKWFKRENGVKIQALDYFGEIRKAWDQGVSLAILEVGFIQNDLKAIQNNIDGIAFLIAKYIAGNCKVTINKPVAPTPPPTQSDVMYRVVCGSFAERKNAEERQAKLKEKGFDSFLEAIKK